MTDDQEATAASGDCAAAFDDVIAVVAPETETCSMTLPEEVLELQRLIESAAANSKVDDDNSDLAADNFAVDENSNVAVDVGSVFVGLVVNSVEASNPARMNLPEPSRPSVTFLTIGSFFTSAPD